MNGPRTPIETPFLSVLGQLVGGIVVIVTAGCGTADEGPDTVTVTGTVQLDGDPVAGAKVLFRPMQSGVAGQSAEAETGEDGSYEMRTHVGAGEYKPGMVPGEYIVTVNKLDTSAVTSTLSRPKNLLPAKYNTPRTSGLKASVVAGQENIVPLDLSSDASGAG